MFYRIIIFILLLKSYSLLLGTIITCSTSQECYGRQLIQDAPNQDFYSTLRTAFIPMDKPCMEAVSADVSENQEHEMAAFASSALEKQEVHVSSRTEISTTDKPVILSEISRIQENSEIKKTPPCVSSLNVKKNEENTEASPTQRTYSEKMALRSPILTCDSSVTGLKVTSQRGLEEPSQQEKNVAVMLRVRKKSEMKPLKQLAAQVVANHKNGENEALKELSCEELSQLGISPETAKKSEMAAPLKVVQEESTYPDSRVQKVQNQQEEPFSTEPLEKTYIPGRGTPEYEYHSPEQPKKTLTLSQQRARAEAQARKERLEWNRVHGIMPGRPVVNADPHH